MQGGSGAGMDQRSGARFVCDEMTDYAHIYI